MLFYVIEIQSQENAGAVIPFTFTDRNAAEAKYHSLLAVAATSEVPKHGAMIFNADGFVMKTEVYNHIEEIEPEEVI